MTPTKDTISKKQQHQNHIQKKRSDAGHFGINTCIRGNLESKMGLIRKHANNKFLWVGIQEPIEFQ